MNLLVRFGYIKQAMKLFMWLVKRDAIKNPEGWTMVVRPNIPKELLDLAEKYAQSA